MSPFFDKDPFWEMMNRPAKVRACDCPGCARMGEFRAPKSRDQLTDYYYFCLAHVREYNDTWDYFAGMSEAEIEAHIRNATVWERPTWPLGDWQKREQSLRDNLERDFFGEGDSFEAKNQAPPMPNGERDALIILELTPPVDLTAIKAQYRVLVKRHHPDANNGSLDAEEKFKIITQAYATLRKLYGDEGP
jgi:hypothetical protein